MERSSFAKKEILQKNLCFFLSDDSEGIFIMEARVLLDYVSYMRGPLMRSSSLEKLRNYKRKSPPVSISYGSKSSS